MGIIGNIEDNIVVIYEIKSFYITLVARKFFPNNTHGANYHFTHSKKLKKTIILRYHHWVVLCTAKDLLSTEELSAQSPLLCTPEAVVL
jgi:hypothetical protein